MSSKYRCLTRVLLAFAALAGQVGLVAQVGSPVRPPGSEVPTQNLPAQRLGPEDLIALDVYESPELTRTFRLSPTGMLTLPMLKTKITASGLLPSEVEEVISRVLVEQHILVDPVVTVSVVEYASRPINVTGAVKSPLTFQAMGKVTLLDALARAGGLTDDASTDILVTNTNELNAGGAPLIRRIPVRGLIDQAKPELNLTLEGGEEIRVPEAGKIFVAGNVKKPGAFPISGTDGCSVIKALAFAEGLMPFTNSTAYIYRHDDKTGKQEISIPLSKIVARKQPDVALLPDDVLYIPDNTGKRNTIGAFDRILGFSTTTASGLLIWKH